MKTASMMTREEIDRQTVKLLREENAALRQSAKEVFEYEAEMAELRQVANAALADLQDCQKQNAVLRADLTDLLVFAKAWSIVWGDKISPKSLEMFQEVESRILTRAALEKKP